MSDIPTVVHNGIEWEINNGWRTLCGLVVGVVRVASGLHRVAAAEYRNNTGAYQQKDINCDVCLLLALADERTEPMKNVKFSYHRDPRNPDRVVTLARLVRNGTLYVGWSMNNPPIKYKDVFLSRTEKGCPDSFGRQSKGQGVNRLEFHEKLEGDTFDKKKGRHIALTRLQKNLEDTPNVYQRVNGDETGGHLLHKALWTVGVLFEGNHTLQRVVGEALGTLGYRLNREPEPAAPSNEGGGLWIQTSEPVRKARLT